MSNIEGLFRFISKSTSPYHAVAAAAEILSAEGYTELYECDAWELADGGKYFVRRSGSSLIAFVYRKELSSFNIVATHSDFPAFRLKVEPDSVGTYSRLNVERYGGPIYYTWFDRPLSLAGRVVVSTDNGAEVRLVDLARDSAVIPSVAPHLNREINSKFSPNPAVDLIPLYALGRGGASVLDDIAAAANTERDSILSYDIYLYNREAGLRLGKDGEFILSPRLDDLASAYASLRAFVCARESAATAVYALFDNEEVGSATKQGAASTFLCDTLLRVAGDELAYKRAISTSVMVSADNAHAVHPNHPELADSSCRCVLGGGVAVKYNADQRYTTDGVSDAIIRSVAKRAGVKLQPYANRADMPGGSTLGSIATTKVPVISVDIGLPQLAMHSVNETAAASDVDAMITLLAEFYSTHFRIRGSEIEL